MILVLNDIFQAPELAAVVLTLETVVRFAAQTLSVGLMQAPGVAKAFWPSGTGDSQIYQISALLDNLNTANNEMTNIINQGLSLVMSDLPTFINFAGHGAFSTQQSLSLPNATNGLNFALKTLITSESLAQNSWYGLIMGVYAETPASGLDGPECMNVTGGIICSDTGDKSQYNSVPATFWSSATNREYTLMQTKGASQSYGILTAINANGWADLATLFDGAYQCTFEGMISKNYPLPRPLY